MSGCFASYLGLQLADSPSLVRVSSVLGTLQASGQIGPRA
jgi:hypothetical protein